jgi:hypothetical protein
MRAWLREPLVHFLAIGSLLFIVFQWSGGSRSGSRRIVITPGQIDAIAAGFQRTWMRPPTDAELKAQLDEHLREEIAAREAIAVGLDRDDPIVRRRLRQKFEFAAEDSIDLGPPGDAELRAWLAEHPASFQVEPTVAFRQLSDSRMLPAEVGASPRSEVARIFGDMFADSVLKVEPGVWTGPIQSTYGAHRVLVLERTAGRQLTLAEARPLVERELNAERRRKHLEAVYAKLLSEYRVIVERRR